MNKSIITSLLLLFCYYSYSQVDKITAIIPNCGIDSEWKEIKSNLIEEYWGVYKEKNYHHWDNFLIKKYDNTESSIPKFLISGLNLKDSIFTTGKWINRMLYPGETIPFSVYNLKDEQNSKNYFIYAKGNIIETEKDEFPYFKKIENYELVVDSYYDKIRQSIQKMDLFSFPSGGFEGGVFIHWIGDLNGDASIDLLVGISEHYAGATLSIFLSDTTSKDLFKEYKVGGCSWD
ncbi:hypothetical protein [uncultured Aquimarina sp.]|uniref:hypothetical protein n=1 Tax=uncultured Aquimarina sp. TaxID=575652 RepID=UPI002623B18A|nr:hypothetical protein [uncultured Aquimarina sp.]